MTLTVCIGSSCHIKGSNQVIQTLEALIEQHHLQEKISLGGAFCLGSCCEGVSVSLDGSIYSVTPETTQAFFEKEILTRV